MKCGSPSGLSLSVNATTAACRRNPGCLPMTLTRSSSITGSAVSGKKSFRSCGRPFLLQQPSLNWLLLFPMHRRADSRMQSCVLDTVFLKSATRYHQRCFKRLYRWWLMLNNATGFRKVYMACGYTDYLISIVIQEECCKCLHLQHSSLYIANNGLLLQQEFWYFIPRFLGFQCGFLLAKPGFIPFFKFFVHSLLRQFCIDLSCL